MRCASCNTVVAGDASFCPRCGSALASTAPESVEATQPGWGHPQSTPPPPPPPGWGQPPAAPAPSWGQQPAAPAWGPPTTTSQTNGMAIASLVLGIAGIAMCLGPLGAVPALIFGYKARGEIDRTGGVQQGRGMAIAGIVLGWIGAAFTVIAIVVVILVTIFGNSTSDTTSSMLRFG